MENIVLYRVNKVIKLRCIPLPGYEHTNFYIVSKEKPNKGTSRTMRYVPGMLVVTRYNVNQGGFTPAMREQGRHICIVGDESVPGDPDILVPIGFLDSFADRTLTLTPEIMKEAIAAAPLYSEELEQMAASRKF